MKTTFMNVSRGVIGALAFSLSEFRLAKVHKVK